MDKKNIGLYKKYYVDRVDGKPIGQCIVLEFKDPNTHAAILKFAETVEAEYPILAFDLRKELSRHQQSSP